MEIFFRSFAKKEGFIMNESGPLSKYSLFSHLDKKEYQAIVSRAQAHRYKSEEWIVHHGDIWPYLFFVQEGEVVAIMESPEGRSLTLTTIRKGEIFWGLAFFITNAPMPAALKTTQDSELLVWHYDTLRPSILENGRFSWELLCLAIQRVQFASEIVEKLAFQPLTGRMARLLLEQFPTSQDVVPRHLTLDEMASLIGTTREVACRILYRFAEEGAIRINRTEFTFINREILDRYSKHTG